MEFSTGYTGCHVRGELKKGKGHRKWNPRQEFFAVVQVRDGGGLIQQSIGEGKKWTEKMILKVVTTELTEGSD